MMAILNEKKQNQDKRRTLEPALADADIEKLQPSI
jgi:hypothetical protein